MLLDKLKLNAIKKKLDEYLSTFDFETSALFEEGKEIIVSDACMAVDEMDFSDDSILYDDSTIPFEAHNARPMIAGSMSSESKPAMSMPMPYAAPRMASKSSSAPSLDDYINNLDETFSQSLLRIIDEKNLKDSAVYKKANIDRRLFSKIRSDEDYVPSKKTVLSFAFALKLTLDETKKLLEKAGYALSSSSRFDVIIMWLITHKEYDVNVVNMVLDEYGEGTLSR